MDKLETNEDMDVHLKQPRGQGDSGGAAGIHKVHEENHEKPSRDKNTGVFSAPKFKSL